jgi:hypothetical protein
MVGCGSRQSPITVSCEHGNEPSATIKGGGNLDGLGIISFSTWTLPIKNKLAS